MLPISPSATRPDRLAAWKLDDRPKFVYQRIAATDCYAPLIDHISNKINVYLDDMTRYRSSVAWLCAEEGKTGLGADLVNANVVAMYLSRPSNCMGGHMISWEAKEHNHGQRCSSGGHFGGFGVLILWLDQLMRQLGRGRPLKMGQTAYLPVDSAYPQYVAQIQC